MKTTTMPSLRVTPEVRKEAESVLEQGESLSSFMLEALTRHIEHRRVQREFLARGLASAAKAKRTGRYVEADTVLGKLEQRLKKAREQAA